MSDLTDYGENALRRALTNRNPPAMPVQLYVGLTTTPTTEAGGGAELVGVGYARKPVVWDDAGAANEELIEFEAGGEWPTATHSFLSDAEEGGNRWAHKPLPVAQTLRLGDRIEMKPGDVTIEFD